VHYAVCEEVTRPKDEKAEAEVSMVESIPATV
jgi:hypothetical protein